MEYVSILGVRFSAVTKEQAVEQAMNLLNVKQKGYIVTPNPEIVDICRRDDSFMEIVNNASLVLPDGIGIIYGARILGENLRERVPGIEFAEALMMQMAKRKMRLFLLGAKPGVAEMAGRNLAEKYPGLVIAGWQDGYFSDDQTAIDALRNCGGADVAFVCLGAPKQERFIVSHLDELDATLFCGLGGSLDVFAGNAKRAPAFFVKHGLEWFYRLLKQPSRIGRMMKLPLFLLVVFKEKLFGRKEIKK